MFGQEREREREGLDGKREEERKERESRDSGNSGC
jgi:hypothetical protein